MAEGPNPAIQSGGGEFAVVVFVPEVKKRPDVTPAIVMMTALGKDHIKKASTPPAIPAWIVAKAMTSCVDVGPGSAEASPKSSRNDSSSIRLCLVTNRSRNTAMWAVGPPKQIKPRGENSFTTEARRCARVELSASSACWGGGDVLHVGGHLGHAAV